MRRISVFLAVAALLLLAVVAYTYKLRLDRERARHMEAAPELRPAYEAMADHGWKYESDDPKTNKPVTVLTAKSFGATHDPSTMEIHDLALRLYDKTAGSYTYVRSASALFDERSKVMKSQAAVFIVMNVPADKNADNPADVAKRVQVETSAITYHTDTGKAQTDAPASFHYPEGDGSAVGAAYDPNTGELDLKSQVSLNWVGHGPAENRMHIEAGTLVYKEKEHKVYLSPWSKLVRQGTTIGALNSLVTLDQDGYLQRIDSERAAGVDVREDKRTEYAADHMTALFNDDGVMTELQGNGHARVASAQQTSRTVMTGDRAMMRFQVVNKVVNGQQTAESDLHEVLADGRAVAESDPIAQPGVQLPETRILRSEHIDLMMRADGKTVQEIQSPVQAQLEFKPNLPDQPHRFVDASRLQVMYGDSSYIDSFKAWKAATRTEKPLSANKKAGSDQAAGPPAPALTWSDELTAKFEPSSNQVANIQQAGHFRYQEGTRKATARTANLQQKINLITLLGSARVADDTGSAVADKIVMNQANGDMDAMGHVVSTHAPDPHQKPGTSMLDDTKTMEAKSDQMTTRNDNSQITYQGHALVWQGANRIKGDVIAIDRDDETLHAWGHVESDLVDNKASGDATASAPVFTVVEAPELRYSDNTRVADYSGGVKLVRDRLTVTSKDLNAYLTPKTPTNVADSSLDHAFAEGDVRVHEVLTNGTTRLGIAEHGEYFTKLNKVVLNGGKPELIDSHKGTTMGRQLTYFSDDDRLIVEGEKNQLAYTQMKKH